MIPERIGRYKIKGELGRGGMATVFHSFDTRLKREVAIKVLPREFMHDPAFRARFEHEAQTAPPAAAPTAPPLEATATPNLSPTAPTPRPPPRQAPRPAPGCIPPSRRPPARP